MKDRIKSITPILKDGVHKYFQSRNSNQVIYLFNVTFESNQPGEFGSIEKTSKFKVGDLVDVTILKNDANKPCYYSVKEFKEGTFSTIPTPLAPNNTLVGIEATKLAVSLIGKSQGKYDFASEEFNELVKKLSRKIAKLMKEVIRTLDADN